MSAVQVACINTLTCVAAQGSFAPWAERLLRRSKRTFTAAAPTGTEAGLRDKQKTRMQINGCGPEEP